jgi:membrane protease YdiL (CAAX protease family)
VLAAIVALLISITTGITEEFAFRGFLLPALSSAFGLPVAYAVSSAAFGLAHYPQFGFNAGVEALLGWVFAYSYVSSGYNIAVPIAVHALYDFATLFLSWLAATRSLKRRMRQAEEQLRGQQDLPLPDEIEFIARAVSSSF